MSAPQLDLLDRPPTAKPVVGAEQPALPIAGTIAGRYATWRASAEGRVAFAEIERRVMAAVAAGARRVEVNLVVAAVRRDLRLHINNDHRALLARELRARHPAALTDPIRIRDRTAT